MLFCVRFHGRQNLDDKLSPGPVEKHLMIKTSEKSWTQRFDDSMSSFSSEKGINYSFFRRP